MSNQIATLLGDASRQCDPLARLLGPGRRLQDVAGETRRHADVAVGGSPMYLEVEVGHVGAHLGSCFLRPLISRRLMAVGG